ncbi:MAG: P-loop NTPase [Chloroflexi bacterium]|nr:P-loop NTPase [Chloroflexota bacterium]
MKQIAVLSAKGGTGKTALVAALAQAASRAGNNIALVDADAQGAELSILLSGETPNQDAEEVAMEAKLALATIDSALCNACGLCREVCRFNAVVADAEAHHILPWACCGCAACLPECPQQAIHEQSTRLGTLRQIRTPYGPLFSALLEPGQENTGQVITATRQRAARFAVENCLDYILIDGPAGTGRAAIAAYVGVDLALLVAEPGPAGMAGLERALKLASLVAAPAAVVVNKATLSEEETEKLVDAVALRDIPFLGTLPFDEALAQAMRQPQGLGFPPSGAFVDAIAPIWQACSRRLAESPRASS